MSLWQTETENMLLKTLSLNRLPPDLRLGIIKILHIPTSFQSPEPNCTINSLPSSTILPVHPSSKSMPTSTIGVAICKILTTHALPGLKASRLESHKTIFSFRATVTHQSLIRKPEDFAEGSEVYVWSPWYQLATMGAEQDVDRSRAESEEAFWTREKMERGGDMTTKTRSKVSRFKQRKLVTLNSTPKLIESDIFDDEANKAFIGDPKKIENEALGDMPEEPLPTWTSTMVKKDTKFWVSDGQDMDVSSMMLMISRFHIIK